MKGKLIPIVALVIFFLLLAAQTKTIKAEENSSPEYTLQFKTQLQEKSPLVRINNAVIHDYTKFYAHKNLLKLSMGIGVAALFANTDIDQDIRDWYQNELRNERLDEFSRCAKLFGEGKINIPIFMGSAVLGELTQRTQAGSFIGTWGKKSLRSILLSVPPLLLLQRTLGASRPDEFKELGEDENIKKHNSSYRFFEDDNGVSGHAFMGAVPFITVAKISDKAYLKIPCYVLSCLTAFSRINDDAHYFSQGALGLWLAFLSADSVFEENKKKPLIISPIINLFNNSSLYGVSLTLKW